MAGGWSLSMMWMRLCGQSWNPAALSFLGMWMAMMVAMMLPALAPMLQRYRRAIAAMGGMHLGWPTALAGAGYFGVWAVCGMAVYLPGAALATRAMADPATARVLPFAAGALVVLGSALQFTAWKARQLACCRAAPGAALRPGAVAAFRHGVHLGLRCLRCCGNLMAMLLVSGLMNPGPMIALTAAIAIERHALAGKGAARAIGAVAICAGLWLIARAAARG